MDYIISFLIDGCVSKSADQLTERRSELTRITVIPGVSFRSRPLSYTSVLMHIHPSSCIYIHSHAYTSALMHIHPSSCIYIHPHAYTSALMHIHPSSCIYIRYTSAFMRIHPSECKSHTSSCINGVLSCIADIILYLRNKIQSNQSILHLFL